MKRLVITAALACVVPAAACDLEIGEPAQDGGPMLAPGFSWEWHVGDAEDGAGDLGCTGAGSDLVRLTIVDSVERRHVFMWRCTDGAGSTSREVAAGTATVTADLLVLDAAVASTVFTFTFGSQASGNDMGTVVFPVPGFDPVSSADASIEWRWGFGDADGWVYPSEQDCLDAGLDTARFWVRNPATSGWWRDPGWEDIPCGARDHGDGEGEWAGFRAPDLLEHGTYQLMIGFYREEAAFDDAGSAADILVARVTSGVAGDGASGVILADDEAPGGVNVIGTSILDPAGASRGPLVIELTWADPGGAPATCAQAGVGEMGFTLANSGTVVSGVGLGQGLGCSDRLTFSAASVFPAAYDLSIVATDADGAIAWHGRCAGLDPEAGVAPEDAVGWACAVENLAAP